MKKLSLTFVAAFFCASLISQLQLPPSGGNQKAVVTQYMGTHAHASVIYNSPDVTAPNGENRTGKIWGQLVPFGLSNLSFGLSTAENPSPWRAGANENTVIKFSHDVLIEGNKMPAGKYGFHLIPQESGPWTAVFSNNSEAWGSYFYRTEEDQLRVQVTPAASEYNEWLTYEFTNRMEESCTLNLKWENLSVPIKIELVNPKEIYARHIRSQMQNSTGFNWSQRNQAANYFLQNDLYMNEALAWQEATVSNPFLGNENFSTLQTLAGLQMKLGKKTEAEATINRLVEHPTSSVFQVHQFGRQLISMGQKDLALSIFQMNLEKNGDIWPVNVGLARGYAAVGQYDMALKHAQMAYARAPDQLNKDSLAAAIEKLKNNQDIN